LENFSTIISYALSSLKTGYRPTDGQTGTLRKDYMEEKEEQNKIEKKRKWLKKTKKWRGTKFGKKEG